MLVDGLQHFPLGTSSWSPRRAAGGFCPITMGSGRFYTIRLLRGIVFKDAGASGWPRLSTVSSLLLEYFFEKNPACIGTVARGS